MQVLRYCLPCLKELRDSAVNWSPSPGVEIRRNAGLPGSDRVPSLGGESRLHMFTFCGMAFLGEGQALSCSWFELDTVLLG